MKLLLQRVLFLFYWNIDITHKYIHTPSAFQMGWICMKNLFLSNSSLHFFQSDLGPQSSCDCLGFYFPLISVSNHSHSNTTLCWATLKCTGGIAPSDCIMKQVRWKFHDEIYTQKHPHSKGIERGWHLNVNTQLEFQRGVGSVLADGLGGLITCQKCAPPLPSFLINE